MQESQNMDYVVTCICVRNLSLTLSAITMEALKGIAIVRREGGVLTGFGSNESGDKTIRFHAARPVNPPEIHKCTIVPPLYCDIVLTIRDKRDMVWCIFLGQAKLIGY